MKKYESVLADMGQKIDQGLYRPGQRLPSVRVASELYECSVSTITRAYSELEKQHIIYSVSQSGHYVVGRTRSQRSEKNATMDFSSASPDPEIFPYLDFQHCLNKAIDTYREQLFTYGETHGMEQLRQTLAAHLAEDQIFAKAEHIVITSGIQQALEHLTKMTFPNGNSVILVEQPSYNNYLSHLLEKGVPVEGIARTATGIDLNELEQRFKSGKIKFFYTMPRFHNPLGTSYQIGERKAIAKLAGRYDVYIVEDDYMADLGMQPFHPIRSHETTSHVIYLKSFSKVIFPGLRLGAVVLPEHLLGAFARSVWGAKRIRQLLSIPGGT